jgi:CDP-diacylglycerol---glycerol-3-phosphate 3-phosphatidyltransferase
MSMLYTFKPMKDSVLQPLSRLLLAAGITPNMVTAGGLILSAAAGLAALTGHLYAGIALFLAGACLDAFDGSFARACGLTSEFGRYFDSISDRCSELLFVAGAVAGGVPASALAVVAGSFVLLASRVYNHRKGLNSDAAMFGRPERLAILILGLLAPAPYNIVLFAIACALCLVSTVQILSSGTGRKDVKQSPLADARKW